MEQWKPLLDLYEISDLGRIRHRKTGRLLSTNKPDSIYGYCRVTLKNGNEYIVKTVHRLVAEMFLDNKDGKTEVQHKNGIKHDNRAVNLEWLNRKEHAQKDAKRKKMSLKVT